MTRLPPCFRPCGRHFLAAALLVALPAGLGANDWQSLIANPPFGQAPVAKAAATNDLEFRGVVQEAGVYLINLYNPATKTAQWIPVNGQAEGLEVKSYDAGSDQVQVTQAGRSLTLPLKQARVSLVAAAPAPPPKNQTAETAANPDNPDRIAQVREFIRARREGGGPGGPGAPGMRNLPPEAQAMIEEFRRRRAEAAANQPDQPRQPDQNRQSNPSRRQRSQP